uniref:Uncharacterized protein n=1 Tax=Ditylenchus dipsaci TaxID=166011 RepID=A0A915DSI5_9BILA
MSEHNEGIDNNCSEDSNPLHLLPSNLITLTISQQTRNIPEISLGEKLPLWVAGASPAKFIALEDILKMNSAIEKMAIVHEIAVDPKFNVEDFQKRDPIYSTVKTTMHKAYWEKLRTDVEKDLPDYGHAFNLLADLRNEIVDQISTMGNLTNALTAVQEVLDLNILTNCMKGKCLISMKDGLVKQLKEEKNLVLLFKGIFELVELMKTDMANFAVSQNRSAITSYSAEIEREEFMKAIQFEPEGATATKLWLKSLLDDFLNSQPQSSESMKNELSKLEITELITRLYLSLLEVSPENQLTHELAFPETLKLDQFRFMGLSEKYLQLILTTSAVFIASNLAGKDVCESTNFKLELKNELIVILNDVSWKKLENVNLQCLKNIRKYNPNGWSEADSKPNILKDQIMGLKMARDSIRLIATNRIKDFCAWPFKKTGELRLPPGLSIVQTELAAFTSKFYAIAIHNWKLSALSMVNFYKNCIVNNQLNDLFFNRFFTAIPSARK